MNYPAANHGVSINDRFYLNAAPLETGSPLRYDKLAGNLTRQISQPLSHIHFNLCNLRNLWIKTNPFPRHGGAGAIGQG